jgi:hypothetical protein
MNRCLALPGYIDVICVHCVRPFGNQISWDTSTVPGHPAARVALSAGWLIIPHALIGLGRFWHQLGSLSFSTSKLPIACATWEQLS